MFQQSIALPRRQAAKQLRERAVAGGAGARSASSASSGAFVRSLPGAGRWCDVVERLDNAPARPPPPLRRLPVIPAIAAVDMAVRSATIRRVVRVHFYYSRHLFYCSSQDN